MAFYSQLIGGVIAFVYSVILLYFGKYPFAISFFDLACCLLVGCSFSNVCNTMHVQRDRFLQISHGEFSKKGFCTKPLLFLWVWSAAFMVGVGVSMYYHSVSGMLVFSGLYMISAGIAHLQHIGTVYRKHCEVYKKCPGSSKDRRGA